MFTLRRPALAATIAAVAIGVLAGCSAPTADTTTQSSSGTPKASSTPKQKSTDQRPAAGEIAAPGTTVNGSDWMTYEFVASDGKKALLQSRIVSLEPATDAQAKTLLEKIPKLKGYDLTLIRLEERKVSGDELPTTSDYSDYDIATSAGEAGQEVTAIGWSECPRSTFTDDFDAGTETITTCFVGAAVPGGDPVAGLLWGGPSYLDENPYKVYGGKPVFLKFTK